MVAAGAFQAHGSTFSLASRGIDASWSVDDGTLRMVSLRNRVSGQAIPLPRDLFALTFADGSLRKASEFAVVGGPRSDNSSTNTAVLVDLRDSTSGAKATWRAIAGPGTAYLRQELTLEATQTPLQVRGITLLDFPKLPDATVLGSCDGSPIVAGTLFLSIEHPLAQADAIYDRASMTLPRKVDVRPGVPLVVSSVIGASRPGQLRRDFLDYVERERAHPYRTFLHYNSWYDIGYFTRYTQDECLDRIHAFGEQLHRKRGVMLKSFLFDDGWDDPQNLWHFNSSFRNGFAPLKDAAAAYGAKPGAWLSPWGGYGDPRKQRLEAAKRDGYEINDDGLALSGPKYFDLFHSVVMQFIEHGGVNQFKLDGTGNAADVVPGSHFGSDFEAAIRLIADMRAVQPDIYVNLTTGTYPSPFWLRYCDSIWRGGNDHDFAGVGSHRQRWITYRDADTYAGVVSAGPLYPLNSVMLHGLIYARKALHLSSDPDGDFRNEIHSYFGTGTQLQEMYITPGLLSEANWNDIASAAKWSAANADVLRDTHWIGGNPARLDSYGWASWSPRKGILVLRNPRDRAQILPLDVAEAFDLPPEAQTQFTARSVWSSSGHEAIHLRGGKEHLFTLDPFEVLVLEATPDGRTL